MTSGNGHNENEWYALERNAYSSCVSVRASGMGVLELEENPQAAIEAITDQAAEAVDRDRAEVIVLGCGGMAELGPRSRNAVPCPSSTGSRPPCAWPNLSSVWG